jgi:hypothetical protein
VSGGGSRTATPRAKLRDELSRRLVPALRERGFTGPERIAGNASWHEFSRAGPHGRQRIDLRLDKYARPRFTLDLHIVPPVGAAWVKLGNLQPRRAAWFRADRPWWQRLVGIRSTLEQEAVSQALALLDEVEAWFEAQRSSEHVLTYQVPWVASEPL